jgi:CheY-like chemotaxis protein
MTEMPQCSEADLGQHDEPAMTRILVVDDDPSVGAAIQIMLARQGCNTVLAADGYAGLQAFEASEYAVVIVDIFMPGMNGLEVIKGFRQRSSTVPILAICGFRFRDTMGPGLDYLGMAAKLGATVCLRKPFTSQQLMAAINASREAALADDHSSGHREPELAAAR